SRDSLIPDEFELARQGGHLRASREIDISGLQDLKMISVKGWDWVKDALGDHDEVHLYGRLGAGARIALIVPGGDPPKNEGVELALDERFVKSLEASVRKHAGEVRTAITKAFSNTNRAGEIGSFTKGMHFEMSSHGITVARGEKSAPNYLYATYG